MATEMVYPLIPLYLSALGAPPAVLGVIEGFAESTASILKVFSGRVSDKLRRRKPLAIIGYSGSMLGRLLLYDALDMTVEFVKPVQIGGDLEAQARVRDTNGKNDAATEGVIYDPKGDVCARATAVFKVFSPAVARRLGIADEASIQWFEKIFKQV